MPLDLDSLLHTNYLLSCFSQSIIKYNLNTSSTTLKHSSATQLCIFLTSIFLWQFSWFCLFQIHVLFFFFSSPMVCTLEWLANQNIQLPSCQVVVRDKARSIDLPLLEIEICSGETLEWEWLVLINTTTGSLTIVPIGFCLLSWSSSGSCPFESCSSSEILQSCEQLHSHQIRFFSFN